MFVPYNPNPIARRGIDCAVRALCKATGRDWEDVYWEICKNGAQMCDMPSSNAVWGALLRKNGWRRYAVPNSCPDCYTVRDFAWDHPAGTYTLVTDKHTVTIQHGDWFDTWDSGDEIPAFYWTKEE